jgi:hypothetical protein
MDYEEIENAEDDHFIIFKKEKVVEEGEEEMFELSIFLNNEEYLGGKPKVFSTKEEAFESVGFSSEEEGNAFDYFVETKSYLRKKDII